MADVDGAAAEGDDTVEAVVVAADLLLGALGTTTDAEDVEAGALGTDETSDLLEINAQEAEEALGGPLEGLHTLGAVAALDFPTVALLELVFGAAGHGSSEGASEEGGRDEESRDTHVERE